MKIEVKLDLSKVNDVQEFVKIVSKVDDADMEVLFSSGRYLIDPKSILGVFCLDLSKPVTLSIVASKEKESEVNEFR